MGGPVYTAFWEMQLKATFLEAALRQQVGQIAAGTYGSLVGRGSTRTTLGAWKTIFGSSFLRQMNGPGWAEASLSGAIVRRVTIAANLVCTACWERRLLEIFPEAAYMRFVGQTKKEIYGSLAVRA
jgi:hypothetical protein